MIPDLPYRPACNTSLIRFSVHGTGCSVSFVGHFSSAVFAVRCTLMHFVRSGFGPTVLTSDGLIKPGSPLWIAGLFRTIIPSKTAGRILGGKTYDRHRFVAGQTAQSLRQRLFRLRRPQTAGPHTVASVRRRSPEQAHNLLDCIARLPPRAKCGTWFWPAGAFNDIMNENFVFQSDVFPCQRSSD